MRLSNAFSTAILLGGALLTLLPPSAAAARFPDPPATEGIPATATTETAVFAGGCFWGVDGVFKNVKGVSKVVSGYSGGAKSTAHYEIVSTGTTGHAESVQITFDPKQVTFGQLLKVYFSVAHDPTELNRQGPDSGTQYRSAIFYTSDEQKRIAESYVAELNSAHVFRRPIVTQIVPLNAFYPAEAHHQNYLALHPDQPYIAINDLPKVENLRKHYPELCKR